MLFPRSLSSCMFVQCWMCCKRTPRLSAPMLLFGRLQLCLCLCVFTSETETTASRTNTMAALHICLCLWTHWTIIPALSVYMLLIQCTALQLFVFVYVLTLYIVYCCTWTLWDWCSDGDLYTTEAWLPCPPDHCRLSCFYKIMQSYATCEVVVYIMSRHASMF